jgi:hypothetical protein
MLVRGALIAVCLLIAPPVLRADDSAPKAKPVRRPRVLLFASAPTREYQFLRSLLVRESDQQHVELSILLQPPPGQEPRPGQVQDVPAERLLANFPERLDAYDVIVAFDPDWSRLSSASAGALKQWVERQGGGLLLVAGPINTLQLARKKVAEKLGPILDLYPVIPEDVRTLETDIDTSKPRRLTFAGGAKDHAFLKLDAAGKDPLAGWGEFYTGRKTGEARADAELRRGFYSYYPVRSVKEKAVVLAALDDTSARLKDGKDQPFLVTMPVGKGRVIYLTSGEMWRLRQQRQAYYERFWLGLLSYVGSMEKQAD